MPIPFVIINLDKPRKLRFGMGAMVEFEEITGAKIQALDESTMTMKIMAQLLWVMLKQEDPELTLAQTSSLVDEYADGLRDVSEKINRAVALAFNLEGVLPNAPTPARKKR